MGNIYGAKQAKLIYVVKSQVGGEGGHMCEVSGVLVMFFYLMWVPGYSAAFS